MRTLIIIPVLLISLFLGKPSYSADFNKGLIAAQNGDFATALKEWKPLAEQGDVSAQYNLGMMYQKGDGVPQDYKEAVYWYRLAAEQEHVDAQYNLGVMYNNGNGVPQDYEEAVRWYQLAAEQGHSKAQGNLGVMYAFGNGVMKDYVYAHMWGNIASMNGNDLGALLRDDFAEKMTSSQIEEAQRLARECVKKNYKGC